MPSCTVASFGAMLACLALIASIAEMEQPDAPLQAMAIDSAISAVRRLRSRLIVIAWVRSTAPESMANIAVLIRANSTAARPLWSRTRSRRFEIRSSRAMRFIMASHRAQLL